MSTEYLEKQSIRHTLILDIGITHLDLGITSIMMVYQIKCGLYIIPKMLLTVSIGQMNGGI